MLIFYFVLFYVFSSLFLLSLYVFIYLCTYMLCACTSCSYNFVPLMSMPICIYNVSIAHVPLLLFSFSLSPVMYMYLASTILSINCICIYNAHTYNFLPFFFLPIMYYVSYMHLYKYLWSMYTYL